LKNSEKNDLKTPNKNGKNFKIFSESHKKMRQIRPRQNGASFCLFFLKFGKIEN